MAARIREDSFTSDSVKQLDKVATHLRKNSSLSPQYTPSDLESFCIQEYTDAAFANIDKRKSQLEYIVFLTDRTNHCHVLHFSSKKSQRRVRSVLAAEVYAFANAYDYAYTLRVYLKRIMKQKIPLAMLIDFKSLFYIINICSQTAEKRLRIDISSIRDAYNLEEISNVRFVRTADNQAESFTKAEKCQAPEKYFQPVLAT